MLNFARERQVKIVPQKARLPFVEKFTIVETLGIMLAAGIPILDALESIEEDATSNNTKGVVKAIRESVQRGNTLVESFSQFPKIFDDIFLSTIKAGEESGNLDRVLKDLSDDLKQTEELKSDIRGAMFYPAIVMGVLVFVLTILLGFVVPRVANVFERLNIPKPLPTQILLSTALFLKEYYLFVLAFLIIMAILTAFSLSNKDVRTRLFTMFFKLPLFGSILKYLDLSRFSQTLSLLLSAGIPIIKAIETSGGVVINQKTKREIEEIKHKLTQGHGLASSMREYKTFPTLMTRIVSTGEQTGNLDKVLGEVASHYHTKLSRRVKTIATALEPILIIIVGVIVGAVILAIISPIYQLIGQIRPR